MAFPVPWAVFVDCLAAKSRKGGGGKLSADGGGGRIAVGQLLNISPDYPGALSSRRSAAKLSGSMTLVFGYFCFRINSKTKGENKGNCEKTHKPEYAFLRVWGI